MIRKWYKKCLLDDGKTGALEQQGGRVIYIVGGLLQCGIGKTGPLPV